MYFLLNSGRSHRRTCLCLLFALLAGSMPGSLSAGLFLSWHSKAALRAVFSSLPAALSLRSFCLWLVFPLLLYAAAVSEQQILFLLAFFGRGFLLAYMLCFAAGCGALFRAPVLSLLFFRGILPLPLYFFAASRLLETDFGVNRTRLRILGLLVLANLLCAGLADGISSLF